MIKVGITGGIGSGKSIVCQVFSKLQIPVYNSDYAARWITDTDPVIREQLISLLGPDIYDGPVMNRVNMAEIIFNDKVILNTVNQIIHPRVEQHFTTWCAMHSHFPYIIQESAILFESNAYKHFHKIVTVTSPEDIRINRTLMRTKMTRDKIRTIMQNQLTEQERIERSDHILVNDGLTLVIPQVLTLHKIFTDQNPR